MVLVEKSRGPSERFEKQSFRLTRKKVHFQCGVGWVREFESERLKNPNEKLVSPPATNSLCPERAVSTASKLETSNGDALVERHKYPANLDRRKDKFR